MVCWQAGQGGQERVSDAVVLPTAEFALETCLSESCDIRAGAVPAWRVFHHDGRELMEFTEPVHTHDRQIMSPCVHHCPAWPLTCNEASIAAR
jgi:hypothetical protein